MIYDIVVYSNSIEEHVGHLVTVFQVLENYIYVKREKYLLGAKKSFIGNVIEHGQMKMDIWKVKAI